MKEKAVCLLEDQGIKNLVKTNSTYDFFSHSVGDHENTHSDFLALLLNFRGKNSEEKPFLKYFLEMLKGKIPDEVLKEKKEKHEKLSSEHNDWEIRREYTIYEGRLDFFLSSKSASACIAIEAKIWAGESEEQMKKYQDWLAKRSEEIKVAVFLTLDDRKPESSEDPNSVACISFTKDIKKILEGVAKAKNIDDQYISSAVDHYLLWLKKKNMDNELWKLIKENPECIEAAKFIHDKWGEIRKRTFQDFLREAKKKIRKEIPAKEWKIKDEIDEIGEWEPRFRLYYDLESQEFDAEKHPHFWGGLYKGNKEDYKLRVFLGIEAEAEAENYGPAQTIMEGFLKDETLKKEYNDSSPIWIGKEYGILIDEIIDPNRAGLVNDFVSEYKAMFDDFHGPLEKYFKEHVLKKETA